jgi:hypothetical protein
VQYGSFHTLEIGSQAHSRFCGNGTRLTRFGGGRSMTASRTNIVQVAISIVAGPGKGQLDRAAQIIGVSSPTLYRWLRAGNLRGARGVDLLQLHDLSGVSLELLLGADSLPAGPSLTVSRGKGRGS